jgi:hypothetical protein
VSEYLTYILWRQREESLPRELERQRVVEERLTHEESHSRKDQVRLEPARVSAASVEESTESTIAARESDLERVN